MLSIAAFAGNIGLNILPGIGLLRIVSTHVRVTYQYTGIHRNVIATSRDKLSTQKTVKFAMLNAYTPYGQVHRILSKPNHTAQMLVHWVNQNGLGYTGQWLNPATDHMALGGFRVYSPTQKRFIQPDTRNTFSSSKTRNAYAYVNGNPVMFDDVSGHLPTATDVLKDPERFHEILRQAGLQYQEVLSDKKGNNWTTEVAMRYRKKINSAIEHMSKLTRVSGEVIVAQALYHLLEEHYGLVVPPPLAGHGSYFAGIFMNLEGAKQYMKNPYELLRLFKTDGDSTFFDKIFESFGLNKETGGKGDIIYTSQKLSLRRPSGDASFSSSVPSPKQRLISIEFAPIRREAPWNGVSMCIMCKEPGGGHPEGSVLSLFSNDQVTIHGLYPQNAFFLPRTSWLRQDEYPAYLSRLGERLIGYFLVAQNSM